MNAVKLAYLSMVRHKFATVISVIAIGMSVGCGGMLLRLYKTNQARFSVIAKGGDAVVGAKAGGIEILLDSLNGEGKYPEFLPYVLFLSMREDLKVQFEDGATAQPSYIRAIIPVLYFAKLDKYRVMGTDDTFMKRPEPDSDLIKVAEGNWFSGEGDVVLGSVVADEKNLKVGDSIQVNHWILDKDIAGTTSLKVSGILAPTHSAWDRQLYANVELAKKIVDQYSSLLKEHSIWDWHVLNYFLIYLKPNGFDELESLVNKRTVGQVVRVEEEKEHLREISGEGGKVGLFVMVFVILLGGLAVCSMLVSRFEGMSLQLAVLRALGHTKAEIFRWLLWEGLMLGVLGCFVGALLDALAFPILKSVLGSALPPSDLVSISIFQSAPIWLVAIAATVFSVFIPMWRLSRQDVHNLLKGL